MSIRAILWALDTEVPSSSKKLVLIALANFSSDSGLAYPAVSTIKKITSQKEQTISDALEELVKSGVIKDTGKRVGQTGHVKVYQLPEAACDLIKTPHMGRASKTPPNTPPNAPHIGGEILRNLGTPKDEEKAETRFSEVAAIWNSKPGIRKAESPSPRRLRFLRARLKEPFFVQNWRAAIDLISESEFCTGSGTRGWKADIDFLLRPDTVIRAMEGQYNNTKSAQPSNKTKEIPGTNGMLSDF